MNIDWAIATFFFVIFAVWSFVFFSGLTTPDAQLNMDPITGKIIDSLSLKVFTLPVIYSSDSSYSNSLLFADLDFSGLNKNATRVYSGGTSLACSISGDTLRWQSDLSAGDNYFTIEVSDNPGPLNCQASLPGLANQTIPLAREKSRMTSDKVLDVFSDRDYQDLKQELFINNEFRVLVSKPGEDLIFGDKPPHYVDVFSEERSLRLLGTPELANITVLVWKLNN